MHLIYIANTKIPTTKAYGYQICKMCETLANTGLEVELWMPARKNLTLADPFSFYGLKEIFKIKTINGFDFLSLFKYLGKISYWLHSLSYFLKLATEKIDKSIIIYTRYPEIAWLSSLKGIKTVFEAHTWPESKIFLYKFLLRKADKIVVLTQYMKEAFAKHNFSQAKILVSPDAVDLAEFDINISQDEARKKLGLPQDRQIVLYTGHLYKWKGVDTLIEASRLLDKNILIYIVGGIRQDLEAYQAKYADYANVKFAGHKPHQEIPFWLKAADILVLPNSGQEKISSLYTSPLKMFEYMASQRPIVASDLPSLREILNESNCVFAQPDNKTSLAESIEKALADPELSGKITANAYRDVQKYSWQKRAEKIFEFIK